jgi:TRAP-type C4-dicarboxylate transport system substrate-binding protein
MSGGGRETPNNQKGGSVMKRSHGIVFLALLSFAVGSMMASVSYAQDSITLRYSNWFGASHELSIIAHEWCKEVEKKTNGKVKVRYFPGGSLVSAMQTYDSILSGVIDVGNVCCTYSKGKFPQSEGMDLPLGFKSGYWATRAMNEYYKKFNPKDLNDVKPMHFHGQAPPILHTTKKPVYKLEDLKGLKVRLGTDPRVASYLGAVPVVMPMGEAYDALSKNVVEGIFSGYEPLKGWKLGEVVKYTTECFGMSFGAMFVVAMNKEKWNSIPVDAQKAIEGINLEWIEKMGKAWNHIDEEGKEYIVQRGNKIIQLSGEENARWAERMQPVIDEYLMRAKEKNLPGEEVVKFGRDYFKAHEK